MDLPRGLPPAPGKAALQGQVSVRPAKNRTLQVAGVPAFAAEALTPAADLTPCSRAMLSRPN